MNWKDAAVDDLRTYAAKKRSLESMVEQIKALNMQLTTVKGAMSDTRPVNGGGSHYEDRILNNIVKRDRLALTYHATKRLLILVDKGLSGLDDDERLVLDKFFVHKVHGENHVYVLMDKLGYEKSAVYNLKDDALYKFTISMYGLPEY
jgi:hypothetical protein